MKTTQRKGVSNIQTFLPYPDFKASANVLSTMHLDQQCHEVVQILDELHKSTSHGFSHHPAILMWRGYEAQLCEYGLVTCEERAKRGFMFDPYILDLEWHMQSATSGEFSMKPPPWFGDVDFHISHQSNLIRKSPEFYASKFVGIPDNIDYVWPTRVGLM